MEECRRSSRLCRWIFYTRTSRIYSAKGWLKLYWRLLFGLFFFHWQRPSALPGRPFRTSTKRSDINNVFCQTHETNLQVLSSSCAGMCLLLTDNGKVYIFLLFTADGHDRVSNNCFWLRYFQLKSTGVAEGKLIGVFDAWSRNEICVSSPSSNISNHHKMQKHLPDRLCFASWCMNCH